MTATGPSAISLRQFPIAQVALAGALGGLLCGGLIMVPLLVLWLGIDQRVAHAASLGAIIPISVAGIAIASGGWRAMRTA